MYVFLCVFGYYVSCDVLCCAERHYGRAGQAACVVEAQGERASLSCVCVCSLSLSLCPSRPVFLCKDV